MKKNTAFAATAIAALTMAAGCASMSSAKKSDMANKGECWGVNKCKAQGECGGSGHACAGQNECAGKGWISLAKADCDSQGGKFKLK